MDSGRKKKNLYRAFAEVATDAYYTIQTRRKNIYNNGPLEHFLFDVTGECRHSLPLLCL